MKNMVLFLGLFLLLPLSTAQADDAGIVKGGVKSVVSGVVSAGKDAISGVTEGVDTGRKEGESTDQSKLVANKADFQRLTSIKVVKSESMGNNQYKLTLALKNDNDFPVRITNLSEPKYIMLIDADGFSTTIDSPLVQGKDITALPKSLTRVRYVFSNVEAEPAIFRFFETDVKVPASVPAPAPQK